MNCSKIVVYVLAEPTHGLFPRDEMSAALQQALQKIDMIGRDCFQRLRDKWREERDKHSRITERGYQMRLAEINREELRFGDIPSIEIEGCSHGFPLRLTIGEKAIIVRFTRRITPDERDIAGGIIPNIETIIANVYPQVRFTE